MLFDPIFQGLAIALMAGEMASLALSRMTVPVVYFMVNRRQDVVHETLEVCWPFWLIPTMNRSVSAARSPSTRLRGSGLISSPLPAGNGGGSAHSESPEIRLKSAVFVKRSCGKPPRCSGIREVSILSYPDGAVDEVPAAIAIRAIASHIRRIRPHVIVTFGPDGAYGHPDHIAVSQFTTAAAVCAADTSYRIARRIQRSALASRARNCSTWRGETINGRLIRPRFAS